MALARPVPVVPLAVPTRYVRLTDEGAKVLASPPAEIDSPWLVQHYPSVQEFVTQRNGTSGNGQADHDSEQTPEETLEQACQQLREDLAEELLTQVKQMPPKFFEQLVVELLVKMGYGGCLRVSETTGSETKEYLFDTRNPIIRSLARPARARSPSPAGQIRLSGSLSACSASMNARRCADRALICSFNSRR